MKTISSLCFIALFIFVSALSVFSQSNQQIETELISGIKDIQKHTIYGGDYDREKLSRAQAVFEERLLKFSKFPSTLRYEFRELDELMSIVTSEDGKLRSYSWDLQDGGTMHRFANVYQYEGADGGVYSKATAIPEDGVALGFVTDIFKLDTKSGKVYIVCSTYIASGKLNLQSADLYRMDGTVLNDKVKLFRTRSGLTNSLRFEYDNFSVIDRPDRPTKLISFDKSTGVLRIPVVIKDEEYPDGRVTDKFISYWFDGRYFEKLK